MSQPSILHESGLALLVMTLRRDTEGISSIPLASRIFASRGPDSLGHTTAWFVFLARLGDIRRTTYET